MPRLSPNATATASQSAAEDEALGALRGHVRLRTLTTLRWLAVAGQAAAVFGVHFGLGYPAPLGLCLGVIAISAWLNLFITLRFSPQRFLSDAEAAGYIAFDIVQLCALLFFTGGLENPFAALILAPVTIAASVLSMRLTIALGVLAVIGVTVIGVFSFPLPWRPGDDPGIPDVYVAGVWFALVFSVLFFAAYAHRIAAESAQMRTALAASQLVLAREERLAALGGLAAAAAHELGTPLATIQVTAKEMADELEGQGLLEDDAKLLVAQAKRCREILSRLSSRGEEGDALHERIAVDQLAREAAEPFMTAPGGPAVIFEMIGEGAPPVLKRRPELIFGLRNFVENAAGYARSKVLITASWTRDTLAIAVHDDGPGFSEEVLARLGEPYVNPRTRAATGGKGGLGLGFFIAKTLLERTGGKVMFDNAPWRGEPDKSGAWVSTSWPLKALLAVPDKQATKAATASISAAAET
jgi:two-component system sensor histidine kinase RegB